MKKNRIFQLICLILVFALTLILSGGNVLSAQGIDVKVQKPKPPPVEEKWGARIPYSDLNLIYGMSPGYIYKDSTDPALTVSVYKYYYNSRGRKGFRYDFVIRIFHNDNNIYLGIQNVPKLTVILPEEAEGIPCGFPPECNQLAPPVCLECFLEGMHPSNGYAMMLLSFSIHDYEILDMKPGDTENISRLNLSLWNSVDNTVDEYHSIITTFWPMGELNEDIYLIKREDGDEDIWTLVVDNAVFGAYEYYRIATNPAQAHSYYPLRTQANDPVFMQIDWIKLKE